MGERISHAEFAQQVHDKLQAALSDGLLDEDQLRQIAELLEAAAERQRLRTIDGGPTNIQIQSN